MKATADSRNNYLQDELGVFLCPLICQDVYIMKEKLFIFISKWVLVERMKILFEIIQQQRR